MYREISRGGIKNQQCGFETRRRKVYERERNGNPVVVSIITMDSFAIFIAKVENRRKHRILIDVIFDRSFPAEFPVPLQHHGFVSIHERETCVLCIVVSLCCFHKNNF